MGLQHCYRFAFGRLFEWLPHSDGEEIVVDAEK
jgi:hypothetical protein